MVARKTAEGVVEQGVEVVDVEPASVSGEAFISPDTIRVDSVVRVGMSSREARDRHCLLGRRAVSATHQCQGTECMAWRGTEEAGWCGLAGCP